MEETIFTQNLTKCYRGVHAVDHVSLRIKKGEIYGFIGLNGAGKTTMIRMLLGMIRPTNGQCFINGQKVSAGNHHIWKQIGYMVGTPYSYPELTVRENLGITVRLRQLADKGAISRAMNRLKLTAYANKKTKHLSMGNAQRLGIAKALLHQPQVLLLDEPTNGLDPAGIVEIRELLQELSCENETTIFISSHNLGEISKIATKIGIINDGKLIQELKKEELDQQLIKKLLIRTRDMNGAAKVLSNAGFSINNIKGEPLETRSIDAVQHPEKLAKILVNANHPPTMLLVEEEDLESYFLRVIGKKGEAIHA
ncbi:ABC transporter ATP-binding protein [Lentibacillus amyloliquefaciens]|uniref:Bacitracin ABC transporter ATP-binding protein n=1 Tax=Lentibacillus amyloliquefaciens TaxID=1472767 RepID=A0A0U4GBV6_9BACI|nr:ABC transporter ATP-binding protein [Lentibacillus amyloliquefaciens]ALX50202.1 bacitracin ABC transporter ATP-binding protein [Lentibacillus amyloliquefaciens]